MAEKALHCSHCGQPLPPLMQLVERLLQTATTPDDADDAYSIPVAAKRIGVSASTMGRYVAAGIVPSVQVDAGGRRVVPAEGLRAFLRDRAEKDPSCHEKPSHPPIPMRRRTKKPGRPLDSEAGR